MASVLPVRLSRIAIAFLIAFLMAVLLLLGLERVGVDPAGPDRADQLLPFISIKSDQANNPNGQGNGSGGNPDKHCNDGKGRDDEKNKHCRELSPG